MPTANARKGSETERMVAKYLREQGFWMADRRLREGRTDDQGDIDGVPFTTIQVKYWAANRLNAWVADTLKQRDNAGTPLCLLIARTKYRAVEGWDTWMPLHQLRGYAREDADEREAWTWVSTPLRAATILIAEAISTRSALSSPTTWTAGTGSGPVSVTQSSAPSTGSDAPA